MHTTKLRKIGDSVVLTVPPAILDQLQLQAGARVGLVADHGCLVVSRQPMPHYTLKELLAATDDSMARSAEEREWLDAPAVGRELS